MLIVLIDYPVKPGELPDGMVDLSLNYSDLEGRWPLGERWEAFTTLEEYSPTPQYPRGIGLTTPQGFVQVLPVIGGPDKPLADPSAAAVLLFRGSGGGQSGMSFDEAERFQLAAAAQRGTMKAGAGGSMMVSGSINGVTSGWSSYSSGSAASAGAVRIGPSTAVKIRDAPAIYPEAARTANVTGVVVVEITIGIDGSVADARVLRSISLLDQAALETVRQWRYQPVVVNGKPVPAIVTVPVAFAPPQ